MEATWEPLCQAGLPWSGQQPPRAPSLLAPGCLEGSARLPGSAPASWQGPTLAPRAGDKPGRTPHQELIQPSCLPAAPPWLTPPQPHPQPVYHKVGPSRSCLWLVGAEDPLPSISLRFDVPVAPPPCPTHSFVILSKNSRHLRLDFLTGKLAEDTVPFTLMPLSQIDVGPFTQTAELCFPGEGVRHELGAAFTHPSQGSWELLTKCSVNK